MGWQHRIRLWFSFGEKGSRHEELDEELMFHFRQLVEDKLATGSSFNEAWREAEQRFGPIRRYEIECLKEEFSQKRSWRPATFIVSCAFLCVGGFWLTQGWQRRPLEHEAEGPAVHASADERVPLTGTVLDAENRPIEGARILLILKTWPNGRYHQVSHHSKTGSDGSFHFENLVPPKGRHAVLVAAVKDGHAFRSKYQWKDDGPMEPVRLVLEPASTMTLEVCDEQKRPIANAKVFPSGRLSLAGETNLIYFMGSEPIHSTTDADGKVPLNYFATGDQAEVQVQLPGQEWESRKIEIPTNTNIIRLSARPTNREWRNLSQK